MCLLWSMVCVMDFIMAGISEVVGGFGCGQPSDSYDEMVEER